MPGNCNGRRGHVVARQNMIVVHPTMAGLSLFVTNSATGAHLAPAGVATAIARPNTARGAMLVAQ